MGLSDSMCGAAGAGGVDVEVECGRWSSKSGASHEVKKLRGERAVYGTEKVHRTTEPGEEEALASMRRECGGVGTEWQVQGKGWSGWGGQRGKLLRQM